MNFCFRIRNLIFLTSPPPYPTFLPFNLAWQSKGSYHLKVAASKETKYVSSINLRAKIHGLALSVM